MLRIEPADPAKLARILAQLRTMEDGRPQRSELRKALRKGATVALRRAKSRVRSLPTRSGRSTGLRAQIARATTLQIRLSGDPLVRVRIARRAMGDRPTLPKRMNQGWQGRSDWANWFDDEMRASQGDVDREVRAVVAEFERRLS